ncbi:MAG: DNA polymerase IV [Euryarchaeota archaeon]|nr:DNA polymerase IV [Euryarchaeota archaeon]
MGKMTILHVDMDSFFSSVETRERPELRGLPVVVGADPKEGKGRGVVSTCSYEAREHGIRSGMPVSRAYKKCPEAVFLPVNMALYRKVSGNIMEILRKYADKFQQISVDEAFLDISKRVERYRDVRELVQKIKEEIWDREKLTCSVGVGPNKFIAKIASDFDKPDGLTVVLEGVEGFLAPLSVRRIPGVGEKTEKALKEMGIETICQLAECDEQKLVAQFGKLGHRLHLLAKGIDESEVIEIRETKSLGREITFEEDTDDPDALDHAIDGLANEVQRVLTDKGYRFRTLTLKIRFEDFETHTRSRSFDLPVSDLELIEETGKELMQEFIEGRKKVRLVGIRVSNLERLDEKQKLMESYMTD